MNPVLMLARSYPDRQREHRSIAETHGEIMLVVINGSQHVILGDALDAISHCRVRHVKLAALVRQQPASESSNRYLHVLVILHKFLDGECRKRSHGVRTPYSPSNERWKGLSQFVTLHIRSTGFVKSSVRSGANFPVLLGPN